MADISIRNLDDEVREQLRVRAAQHGRSMEAEIRSILEDAVRSERGQSFVGQLLAAARAAGGVELEIPCRVDLPRPVDLS